MDMKQRDYEVRLYQTLAREGRTKVTTKEASEILESSAYTARFAINSLVDQGALRFLGGGGRAGTRRYEFVSGFEEILVPSPKEVLIF